MMAMMVNLIMADLMIRSLMKLKISSVDPRTVPALMVSQTGMPIMLQIRAVFPFRVIMLMKITMMRLKLMLMRLILPEMAIPVTQVTFIMQVMPVLQGTVMFQNNGN